MSTCRTCNRPIRWAKTESGHNIPIDIEPREGGNVELLELGPQLVARIGKPGSGRWVSHFTSCPQADAHRKERRR